MKQDITKKDQNNYFTKIPNNLLDKMYSVRLSDSGYRILLFIIRQTFGWQREDKYIQMSAGFISENTLIPRRTVEETLSILKLFKIISIIHNNLKNCIKINDVGLWNPNPYTGLGNFKNNLVSAEGTFTKISNEMLNKIIRTKITAAGHRILLFVIRMTLGYHREWYFMSIGFISKNTGIPRRTVEYNIRKLNVLHIIKIKRIRTSNVNLLGIEDIEIWDDDTRLINPESYAPIYDSSEDNSMAIDDKYHNGLQFRYGMDTATHCGKYCNRLGDNTAMDCSITPQPIAENYCNELRSFKRNKENEKDISIDLLERKITQERERTTVTFPEREISPSTANPDKSIEDKNIISQEILNKPMKENLQEYLIENNKTNREDISDEDFKSFFPDEEMHTKKIAEEQEIFAKYVEDVFAEG